MERTFASRVPMSLLNAARNSVYRTRTVHQNSGGPVREDVAGPAGARAGRPRLGQVAVMESRAARASRVMLGGNGALLTDRAASSWPAGLTT